MSSAASSTSSAGNGFRQDMPPPGGYANIEFNRILPKRMFKNWTWVVVSYSFFFYGIFYYKRRKRYLGKLSVERFDHVNALEPLLQAERDRAYLRHMRYNRDTERELMKNVSDWEVGTLWGEKVYKTLPEGVLPDPTIVEWYAHRSGFQTYDYTNPDLWT